MDLVQASNPIRNRRCRRVVNHFEQYSSPGFARSSVSESGVECTWVVCRFSPHCESVLYLGDDEGYIGILDVASDESSDPGINVKRLHFDHEGFIAHEATVMDLVGVPNCPGQLLSISGDTTVRLWDIQRQQSTLYFGHEMSVRSVCFAPDNCNVFATGGRDGQVRLWDTRTSCFKKQGKLFKKPVNVYRNAHVLYDFRTTPKRRSLSARLSGRSEKAEPPSITSLIYVNEYTLVSGSSNAKSGLRLWDTRKFSVKEEGQVLSTLEVPISKDAGITSLCLDRYGSSLFAAVTDNCVYEYGILTSNTKPIRHFTGAAIESFYVQVQASPVNDFLLCGSKNKHAVMWDLQDLYCHDNECIRTSERQYRALLPKFTLNGHDSEVCCVGWSRAGRYIVSMDDEHFRVWSADRLEANLSENTSTSNKETFTVYELNESEKDMVAALSCGRNDQKSRLTLTITSSRKRKERLTSPTKPFNTPAESPVSKMTKLTSPVLPLSNITNIDSVTPGLGNLTTPHSHGKGLRRGAFHYRYPTENLPNKVYERFVANFKAKYRTEAQDSSSSTPSLQVQSTTKKNMDDYYVRGNFDHSKSTKARSTRLPSITEFGDSVFSKMLSEQDRALQNSPRKLTVKLTPLKTRPTTQLMGQCSSSQKRSSRNLLDYFSKK